MPFSVLWPDDGQLPKRPAAGGPTVSDVVAAYLNHLAALAQAGEYSRDALANVRRDLERFAAWCRPCKAHRDGARPACRECASHGERSAQDCCRNDLVDWLLANPQWKSNHTKRRVLAGILACFAWAADEADLIPASPYKKPRRLRLPVKPRREARPEEYLALMRKGSRPLRRALYFLRRTGARTCEMREVEWPQIDWENSVVVLVRHKTDGSTAVSRRILLDPGVLRFLRNLKRQAVPGQQKVFVNTDGTAWDRHTFARHLRRYAKRIGLDEGAAERVSAYCLRHFFTGLMGEHGWTDRQVATMLGHSSTRMVSNYNHNRENQRLLRQLASELRKKKPRQAHKPRLPTEPPAPFLPGMEP